MQYNTLDVFTNKKFRGNQLAVVNVPKDRALTQDEKQKIAKEFNYSETVFVHDPIEDFTWPVDIFTVEGELPFAGHPTIGTIVNLFKKYPKLTKGTLQVKAGRIPFTVTEDGVTGCNARAEIPHNVHIHQIRASRDQVLLQQPNLEGYIRQEVLSFPVATVAKGLNFVLVELDSYEILGRIGSCKPLPAGKEIKYDAGWESMPLQATYYYFIDKENSSSNQVTARCRMMETSIGEDAATGSAATTLASYLALELNQRGEIQGESLDVKVEQGVHMGRKSDIGVTVKLGEDGNVEEIVLAGNAVHVMAGTIY